MKSKGFRNLSFKRFISRASPLQKLFAAAFFALVIGLITTGWGIIPFLSILIIGIYAVFLALWYKENR